jgi:isopenicillin N synthase-like dioxygenase
MTEQLPVIDLSGLESSDHIALHRIAREIGKACRTIGFFYVVNHGVATIPAAFTQSTKFFAEPLARKRALAIETVGGNRGYSGLLHEALDPTKGADMKEAFNIGLDLAPDDPELLAGVPFRSLNAWPDLPNFKRVLLGYFDDCIQLGQRIHRAFALDLGLHAGFFEDKLDRSMATLRMLHYPALPADAPAGQMGAGEHTDYGNITLLATDEVGGLEVKTRGGQWIAAPVMPGAYVVNIGDCLMRWTNDIYVSTPHRVVNRSGRERYSIAYFFDPAMDAVIDCLPTCRTPDNPPRYAPVRYGDYLLERLDKNYAYRKTA